MVKQYSVKRDGSKALSRDFQVREFASKDGSDAVLVDDSLVALLQKIRDHFGKPVVINSGYRSPAHNKAVGGVANSQHTLGTAADIVVQGVSPLLVGQYAEYLMPDSGGIGVYVDFTHVDVRAARSRWDNRSGKEVGVEGWPGYTMTMRDVQDLIEAAKAPVYGVLADVPQWYRPTIRKLLERGYMGGESDPNPDSIEDNVLNVSEEFCRIMTVLDNAGVFYKKEDQQQ